MKTILIATMIAFLASPAWAGATSIRGSIVGYAQQCDTNNPCQTGSCQEGGASCSTNADCNICGAGSLLSCQTNADCFRGSISPSSKIQISGSGQLKAIFKGVTDSDGALLTTDGIVGSADDYLLIVSLGGGVNAFPSVKVDFKKGKAKVAADLSSIVTGDQPVSLFFAVLTTAPQIPAECPGTNSPADIQARDGDDDCDDGIGVGLMGLLPGQ